MQETHKLTKFHCPNCGRYVANVFAEEYGELQDSNGWYPYYEWRVVGDCKQHGRVEIKDHNGEEGCDCWSVNESDCWWSED
jgi:hypothetical protein